LLNAGRLDEAYDLLVRYRFEAAPFQFVRFANAFRERGDTSRAIELYRRALKADPTLEPARKALAELGSDVSDLVPAK